MDFSNSQSCPKGHVLFPVQNLATLHPESRGGYHSNIYRCDVCSSSKNSTTYPCYHCSTCKYDLCPSCFQDKFKTALFCFEGHNLIITRNLSFLHPESKSGYSVNRYGCNECKASNSSETDPSYHCSQCKFDLCSKCASAQLKHPSGRKCDYGHDLYATRNLSSLHPESKGGYSMNRYGCNQCKASKSSETEPSYHCSHCKFDLCHKCASAETVQEIQSSGRKCNYGHKLIPTTELASLHPESQGGYRSNIYRCDVCSSSKSSKSYPSHHCSVCKYDLCPDCAMKPNTSSVVATEPVHKNNNQGQKIEQNVQSQPSSNDQILCVICLSANRSCVFDPCKHLCTCEHCSSELLNKKQHCPRCRSEIKSVIKIFLA